MCCVSHITPIEFKQKRIQNYISKFQILQNHEIAQSRADISENFPFDYTYNRHGNTLSICMCTYQGCP